MKTTFKLVSVLLIVMITLSFIVGCVTQKPTVSSNDKSSETSSVSVSSQPESTGSSQESSSEYSSSEPSSEPSLSESSSVSESSEEISNLPTPTPKPDIIRKYYSYINASSSSGTTVQNLWEKKKQTYGYMIMGMTPLRDLEYFRELVRSDYVNQLIVNPSVKNELEYSIAETKNYNVSIWYNIHWNLFDWTWTNPDGSKRGYRTALVPGWKANLEAVVTRIKAAGGWDSCAGWYLDEPVSNGIQEQSLIDLTKYAKETYGKRFLIIDGTPAFNPAWWDSIDNYDNGYKVRYTPQNTAYVTDIGFDVYANVYDGDSFSKYAQTRMNMKLKTGNRADMKYWYVPRIMNYAGNMTEQTTLDHINLMKAYFQDEKPENAGGLLLYTMYADGIGGNVGYFQMKDTWKEVTRQILRNGKLFCSGVR